MAIYTICAASTTDVINIPCECIQKFNILASLLSEWYAIDQHVNV